MKQNYIHNIHKLTHRTATHWHKQIQLCSNLLCSKTKPSSFEKVLEPWKGANHFSSLFIYNWKAIFLYFLYDFSSTSHHHYHNPIM